MTALHNLPSPVASLALASIWPLPEIILHLLPLLLALSLVGPPVRPLALRAAVRYRLTRAAFP